MLEPLHIQGNLFVVSNYPPSIYQEIRKRENPRQNYDAEITAKCFVAGEMDDVIRWDYTRSITLYAGMIRDHALHRNEHDQRPIHESPNTDQHAARPADHHTYSYITPSSSLVAWRHRRSCISGSAPALRRCHGGSGVNSQQSAMPSTTPRLARTFAPTRGRERIPAGASRDRFASMRRSAA